LQLGMQIGDENIVEQAHKSLSQFTTQVHA
jgi:hypothetical protein